MSEKGHAWLEDMDRYGLLPWGGKKKNPEERSTKRGTIIRILVCLAILVAGFGGFRFLKSQKKVPTQAEIIERPLKVEVADAVFSSVPVIIEGHGELSSTRTVDIAAEVAGTVVEIHPRLQTGAIINKGELLFAIDDRDYRAEYERSRYAILLRDKDLAEKEMKRLGTLYEKNRVGTRAGVERAEKAVNTVANQLAQVKQAMIRAEIKLERCRVTAPFTCRITKKNIEKGQYVAPGKIVLGLADDSTLQIEVPLDGSDAFRWLGFGSESKSSGPVSMAWFSDVNPVPCKVGWTENEENHAIGTLARISSFDEKTRTVKVVIDVDSKQFQNKNISMPLVAGMFCRVEIPGNPMVQVVELPRRAVSFEDTVYVVKENRLHTVPVKVARVQNNNAYISEGLESGDKVITTRLVNPLEKSLVEIVENFTGAIDE